MTLPAEENDKTKSLQLKFVSESEFEAETSKHKKDVFRESLTIYSHQIYSEEEIHKSEANMARFAKLESLYCLLLLGDECIGWHYGYQIGPMSYYMCNSAILPEFRRQGYYTWLASKIIEEITARGYHRITSRHHPTNNPIIIAKLKLGFVVTGLQLAGSFGTLIELERNSNQAMAELIKFRCGAKLPQSSTLEAIGLTRL